MAPDEQFNIFFYRHLTPMGLHALNLIALRIPCEDLSIGNLKLINFGQRAGIIAALLLLLFITYI